MPPYFSLLCCRCIRVFKFPRGFRFPCQNGIKMASAHPQPRFRPLISDTVSHFLLIFISFHFPFSFFSFSTCSMAPPNSNLFNGCWDPFSGGFLGTHFRASAWNPSFGLVNPIKQSPYRLHRRYRAGLLHRCWFIEGVFLAEERMD